jgi:hypothetical protein
VALALALSLSFGAAGLPTEYAMASDIQQRALAGSLDAQRELADCLTKGSCPGIAANRALACAWRIAIVAGGNPGISAADVEARRLICENLSPPERTEATAQARTLVKQIYGRELALPADFFGGPARAK